MQALRKWMEAEKEREKEVGKSESLIMVPPKCIFVLPKLFSVPLP